MTWLSEDEVRWTAGNGTRLRATKVGEGTWTTDVAPTAIAAPNDPNLVLDYVAYEESGVPVWNGVYYRSVAEREGDGSSLSYFFLYYL